MSARPGKARHAQVQHFLSQNMQDTWDTYQSYSKHQLLLLRNNSGLYWKKQVFFQKRTFSGVFGWAG